MSLSEKEIEEIKKNSLAKANEFHQSLGLSLGASYEADYIESNIDNNNNDDDNPLFDKLEEYAKITKEMEEIKSKLEQLSKEKHNLSKNN